MSESTKTVRDILLEAADIVDRGWFQGWWANIDGTCFCAYGAIRMAAGGKLSYVAEDRKARYVDVTWPAHYRAELARNRLHEVVGPVAEFNDQIARSSDDVSAALRIAADLAA